MGEYLYSNKTVINIYYDDWEIQDIIDRCRYLRSIKREKAIELIIHYAYGINKIFDKNNINYIIAEIVDNYCMDVIYREALKRKIKVISPMGTFISGYMRFTVKGEIEHLNRIVLDEEAQIVLNRLMDKNFKGRVGGLGYSNLKTRYSYFYRRILIEKYLNPIRKIVKRDKYNNLYNTILYKSSNVKNYLGKKVTDCFTDLKNFNFDKNDVYLPLHCTPEATTEYFCDSSKFGYYENAILDVLNTSSDLIRFIVKDHPVMYGVRDVHFYKELLKHKNVILINPLENSNYILDKVNNVLVCTGSVGVEALIRNKKVFCLSNNYYSKYHPNAYVVNKLLVEDIEKPIITYSSLKFIKDILSFHVPLTMYGYNDLLKTDFDKLGLYIKEYFIHAED